MRCITFVLLCVVSLAQTDPRIPSEARHKSRYVNRVPKPANFTSAMLWGIAIADTRVPGYQKAQVEISHTQLTCRVDGKNIVLNDDEGELRGGLYRRHPWFGTDEHDPMPGTDSGIPTSRKTGEKRATPESPSTRLVMLRVGSRPDRVWHFWAASPRAMIPAGHLDGCTVKVRVRISSGARLQVGFDYWRNPTVEYGSGGNNHEAGASDWYFPSDKWQEAVFSDMPK
jgi:hypothetical protein